MSCVYNVTITRECDLCFLGTFSSLNKAKTFAKKFPSSYGYLTISEVVLDKAYLIDVDTREEDVVFGKSVFEMNKEEEESVTEENLNFLKHTLHDDEQKKFEGYRDYCGIGEEGSGSGSEEEGSGSGSGSEEEGSGSEGSGSEEEEE